MDVSAKALCKSGRVHKALCRLYFPFHSLHADFFFDHFGAFSVIEGTIYDIDESNENGASATEVANACIRLNGHLAAFGIRSTYSAVQLRSALRYWTSERKHLQRIPLTPAEVRLASRLRSFDFRLLHLAALTFASLPFDRAVFRGFSAFEAVMELDDDLTSQEKDQLAGSFNTAVLLNGFGETVLENFKIEVTRRFSVFADLDFRFAQLAANYVRLVPQSIITH